MKRISIAALALLLVTFSAHAMEPAYDYVTLRGGVFTPRGSSVRQFGSGFDAEIAVGRAFLPFLAGELGAGIANSGDTDVMPGTYQDPGTFTRYSTRQRYRFYPITASVKVILPAGTVEPFLGAGFGLYLARAEWEVIGTSTTVKASENPAGFHAIAGATIAFGPRFFGGVDARYVFVKTRYFNQGTVDLGGLRATALLGARF